MSCLITGVLFDKYDFLIGTADPRAQLLHPPPKADQSSVIYVKPYCRMGPYLVGIALGYILREKPAIPLWDKAMSRASPSAYQFVRSMAVFVGWCVSAVLLLAPLFGMYGAVKNSTYMSHNAAVVYASFNRLSWALGLAWIIYACHHRLASE